MNMHIYEVRPRRDRRGVDLISDVLPFGRVLVCRAECRREMQSDKRSITADQMMH